MKAPDFTDRSSAATPLWPWLVLLACTGIVITGALAAISYIVLALIGY
jgi:hypothetical protein